MARLVSTPRQPFTQRYGQQDYPAASRRPWTFEETNNAGVNVTVFT
jgi:hypothetical protein